MGFRHVLALVSVTAFVGPVFASDMVVKECSTQIKLDQVSSEMMIQVISNGNFEDEVLKARVTQRQSGAESSYIDSAKMSDHQVRADLLNFEKLGLKLEDLNLGETLVLHAAHITLDPDLGGMLTTGIDLSKVRKVKVYEIGERTKMGLVAIVEARDAQNKLLGSFMGGFLIGACK